MERKIPVNYVPNYSMLGRNRLVSRKSVQTCSPLVLVYEAVTQKTHSHHAGFSGQTTWLTACVYLGTMAAWIFWLHAAVTSTHAVQSRRGGGGGIERVGWLVIGVSCQVSQYG